MKKVIIFAVVIIVISIAIVGGMFIIRHTKDSKVSKETAMKVAEIKDNSNYLGEEYCFAFVSEKDEKVVSKHLYPRHYRFYLNNNDNTLYCILDDVRIIKITNEDELNRLYFVELHGLMTDLINSRQAFDENGKEISTQALEKKLEAIIVK